MLLCIAIGVYIILMCLSSKNRRQHEFIDEMNNMTAHPIDINVLSNCYMSSVNRRLLKKVYEIQICTLYRFNRMYPVPFESSYRLFDIRLIAENKIWTDIGYNSSESA